MYHPGKSGGGGGSIEYTDASVIPEDVDCVLVLGGDVEPFCRPQGTVTGRISRSLASIWVRWISC